MSSVQAKLGMSLDDIISSNKSGGGKARRSGGGTKSSPYEKGKRPALGGRGRTGSSDGGAGRRGPVSNRVFVGNLAWGVEWMHLKDHMRAAGEVLHADVLKEASGRSKGVGIVEYSSAAEARKAIRMLHDSILQGRQILVRHDKEAGGGGSAAGAASVYVGNLPWEVEWQDLKDLCKSHGEVVFADVVKGSDGRSRGFGLVTFASMGEAQRAIAAMNGAVFNGRPLEVRFDRDAGAAAAAPAPRAGRAAAAAPVSFVPAGAAVAASGTAVFVKNLPWSLTWQQLKDLCKQYGPVERSDIPTKDDGRSKGWGTVVFRDPASAQCCIAALNGAELDGLRLEARLDRGAGPAGPVAGAGFVVAPAGPVAGEVEVYIGNLPWSVTWQELKDACRKFGDCTHTEIAAQGGRSLGWGLAKFSDMRSAQACIAGMNGAVMDGRPLEVRMSTK